MTRLQRVLAWLCALMLGIGAPLRAGSTDLLDCGGDHAPAGSCCGTDHCHCGDGGAVCLCRHDAPRQPGRAPEAPAPLKVAPALALASRPSLPHFVVEVPMREQLSLRRRARLRSCPIPSRSRQEVLSVWRC